jgi:hypothetical protein
VGEEAVGWLFGKSRSKDPAGSLNEARDLLWKGNADSAIPLLTSCIDDQDLGAIALAYRSLAHRMKSRVSKAITDAALARQKATDSVEAIAAQLTAALTNKDVPAAGAFLWEI